MRNFLHNKFWPTGVVKIHVEPPSIILIKSRNNEKSEDDCVKNKFRRDPTSEKSYLYEFKMALFDKWTSRGVLVVEKKRPNDSCGFRRDL